MAILATELKSDRLWWEGPQWLTGGVGSWPSISLVGESMEMSEERKKDVTVMTVSEEPIGLSQVMNLNRYSTLRKILRITAYVCRFINNLKKKLANEEIKFGKVEVEKTEKAELQWVNEVQKALEGQSGYQKYKEHLGVVERNGILTREGRLEIANIESRTKRSVLLPKDYKFTELVILDCHNKVHHCKVNATPAELRSSYWVV